MKENEISKKEVIATTVVIIILVLFLVSVYNYYSIKNMSQQPRIPPAVWLEVDVVTEDYIRYNVSSIAEHSDEEVHQGMYGEEYYEYEIYNVSRYHDPPYLRGDLSSIRNITDHPVIWIDNDGDHQISVSDNFIINLEDIPDDMDRFILTYDGPYFGSHTACGEDISDLTANLSGSDDMSRDGMPTKYEKDCVANGGWQNPYLHNARYALLIAGGGDYKADFFPAFWDATKEAYDKLVDGYNYHEENVYLMSSRWHVEKDDGSYEWVGHNSTTDEIVDGECIWEYEDGLDIKDAIREIGQRTTKTDFIYVQIYSHGWTPHFLVREEDNGKSDPLYYDTLFREINKNWGGEAGYERKYARTSMIIASCSSELAALRFSSGKNRIGISSSEHGKVGYTQLGSDGEQCAFLQESREMKYIGYWRSIEHEGFLRNLGTVNSPYNIYHAYQKGYYSASNNYRWNWFTGNIKEDYRFYPQIFKESLAADTYL